MQPDPISGARRNCDDSVQELAGSPYSVLFHVQCIFHASECLGRLDELAACLVGRENVGLEPLESGIKRSRLVARYEMDF